MADWLDWQSHLRQLAEQSGAEGIWPDPNMQKLENSVIKHTSESAMLWMFAVWPIIQHIIRENRQNPIPQRQYNEILKVTDEPPINMHDTIEEIASAGDVARRAAKHQMSLPQKGPWVDVPKGDEHIVQQPRLRKQAEWQARMSAASKMKEWAEGMREDVRWHVVQAIRDQWDAKRLEEELKKRWQHYGEHMGMIAVTELSLAYNDAYLLAMPDQHVVVPTIHDDRVCTSCHTLLEGKVFWVAPRPIQDADKQQGQQWVWAGKSNVGRKRDAWWPCIPLHPRCRHVYVRYRGGDPYNYKVRRHD